MGEWLTIAQAAEVLQVDRGTVRRWAKAGKLPSLQAGSATEGPTRWPPAPDDVRAWGRVPALSQPSICRLADGVPPRLVRDRRRALKALGNAVVPQVAEVVGRVVMEIARQQQPWCCDATEEPMGRRQP